jgi:acyl-CoA synthetase (AMP-forming)/AMP-acid ligase II
VIEDRPSLASRILSCGSRIDGRSAGRTRTLVDIVGSRLAAAGVRARDVVVLTESEPADLIAAVLAVWLLDAVPLIAPHDGDLPEGLSGVWRLHGAGEAASVDGGPAAVAGLDQTAILMPTSGSTGAPKLARRGIASVLAESAGYRDYLGLVGRDRVALPVPITHSYGCGVAISALLTGCDLVTTPPGRLRALARLMDSGEVSVVALTPPLARLLIDVKRDGQQSVRAVLVGAGGVPDTLAAAFAERFGRPLHRGYGSTETGGTFLGTYGIGRPIAGVRVRQPGVGGRGELVLELDAPVQGYLGDEPTQVWRTGDVVECDADGVFHHVERLRPAFRLNNRHVDPGEIVEGLRGVAGVTDVHLLVLGREKTPETEDLYAVLEGGAIDEGALNGFLTGLPTTVPRPRIVRLHVLPRNAVGKVDRDALIGTIRQGKGGDPA